MFGEAKEALYEDFSWRHLLGRIGKPDEVGHMIAFLLSDKASFITGQNIVIDGGFDLLNPLVDVYTPYVIAEEHRKPGHYIFARIDANGKDGVEEPEL